MPLTVVILAAGQGKRMHSDLPKVLQPLAGQPLLQHVIRTARAAHPRQYLRRLRLRRRRRSRKRSSTRTSTGCCRPSSSARDMR